MAGAFDDLVPAQQQSNGAFSDLVPSTRQPSFGERVMRGVRDPIDGGAQLLTNLLPTGFVQAGNRLNNRIADATGLVARIPEGGVDQMVRDSEASYQASRGPDAGVDWARIGGNVVSPANLAIASRIPAAASLGGRVLAGAVGGAASGALNPVAQGDFGSQKLSQIGVGGAFGGAAPVVTSAIGRLVSPAASRNPQLQMLRDEGIRPTIGQSLGGAFNRAEEASMSLPLMGDMVRSARSKAQEDFNRAALNRVGAPIGARASGTGSAAVADIGDAASAAQESAKNMIGAFQLDQQAASELAAIRQMATSIPDRSARTSVQNILDTVDNQLSPKGTILADGFKRLDSKLGKEGAMLSGASDAYQQQAGDAVKEVQRVVREAALRQNPQAAAEMQKANAAWANLVRIEGAAKAAANNDGVFTPAQLMSAVRQSDKSVRDRATARGTALMQDLAGAGQSVLGNKLPNSGTADRLMLGGAGLGAYFVDPLIPAALLGGAAMYSRPAQSLLNAAATQRPQVAQSVRNSLLQASPTLVPAASQVGIGLLNYQ